MSNSQKFIKIESTSTKLVLSMAILALIICNTPWYVYYKNVLSAPFLTLLSHHPLKINLSFIINEGLMTLFFLVVGLEIKYEVMEGTLNSISKAMLPTVAAIGGMLVPAIIYVAFNYHNTITLRGWAIPTATDIAFALSALSFLGSKVPSYLKTFLMALAIIDDLIAIVIIAFFYSSYLSYIFLGLAFLCLSTLALVNFAKITHLSLYYLLGFILWLCLLNSGVHATLAGVLLAFLIPLRSHQAPHSSPLHYLKNHLHPWVALGILPLFAFANAGLSFTSFSLESINIAIVVGITLGLFIGKQLGVFTSCWLACKLRVAELPPPVSWSELYPVAIFCGIGFTISLFIGNLAFYDGNDHYINSVKIGVMMGSLLSGIIGYIAFLANHQKRKKRR